MYSKERETSSVLILFFTGVIPAGILMSASTSRRIGNDLVQVKSDFRNTRNELTSSFRNIPHEFILNKRKDSSEGLLFTDTSVLKQRLEPFHGV